MRAPWTNARRLSPCADWLCSAHSRGIQHVEHTVVAILLIAAVPVCAWAQNPSTAKVSKGDAEKVATIISGDKAKTQTYCDIQKLGEQMAQAHEKRNLKLVEELLQKIDTMEKTLGPEYVALIDGVQEIAEDDQLRAEFLSVFGALVRLCTR